MGLGLPAMKMDELLQAIMKERGLTLSEFTALLGYQSKTSLMRVLRNQTNQRALESLAKKLCEAFDLTAKERRQLDEALEYMQWQEDYQASREMIRFLKGELTEEQPVTVECVDNPQSADFRELYANATKIRITMLNCQFISIFPALCNYVRQRGAEVEHFLMLRDSPIGVLQAINVLIPLLYEPRYSCYSRRIDKTAQCLHAFGVLASDIMVVQYVDAAGDAREDLIAFDRPDHGLLQSNPMTGGCLRLLGIPRELYTPVKRTYGDASGMESYVQFSAECARLEYNRAMYVLKPDICIDWIPVDILEAALLEGGIPSIAHMPELIDQLRSIFQARSCNTFEKHKVARTILKRSAMVRFARTGRMMDHFWGMRPFTQQERVRILEGLLAQIENNPYFNVYFLKDNDFLRDATIGYYEGAGVLVLDCGTDYSLGSGYSEVMITHPEFARLFKEYFDRVLLAGEVVSFNETINFMRKLIRIAEEQGETDS